MSIFTTSNNNGLEVEQNPSKFQPINWANLQIIPCDPREALLKSAITLTQATLEIREASPNFDQNLLSSLYLWYATNTNFFLVFFFLY